MDVSRGIEPEDPAPSLRGHSIDLPAFRHVVRTGSIAGDFDVVIEPLEQSVPIKVQRLFATDDFQALGEPNAQAASHLSVFLPFGQLAGFYARPREHKRYIRVGPHRAAGE